MKNTPRGPSLAYRLLLRLVPADQREIILGDFEEGYAELARQHGESEARRWFWMQLFRSLPAFLAIPIVTEAFMQRHFTRVAVRNMRRHFGFSAINISGLALGLASCALILLFVRDEFSYDAFHEKGDRIFRVVMNVQQTGSTDRLIHHASRVGREIRREFPEVEHVIRMSSWSPSIKHEGRFYFGDRFLFAEPGFFDTFSYRLLRGDQDRALEAPNTVVLTESMEAKYFGKGEGLGQTLILNDTANDTLSVTVTGVMADLPRNTHLQVDFILSYPTRLQFQPENNAWLSNLDTNIYLLLHEGVNVESYAPKLSSLLMDHLGDGLSQRGITVELELEPIADIHLRSAGLSDSRTGTGIGLVRTLLAIAALILLVAAFNYINLSTARSTERLKEVGMRKICGSGRGLLIRQFLGESVASTGAAFLLALVLIAIGIPYLNGVAEKDFSVGLLLDPNLLIPIALLAGLLGLLAGSYPAFVFSGFSTMAGLRGRYHRSTGGSALRKALVVVQFSISVVLIVGATVVWKQLAFMRSTDLGFDAEQVVVVDIRHLPSDLRQRQSTALKSEFGKVSSVVGTTSTLSVPGRPAWFQGFVAEGMEDDDSRRGIMIPIDHDYVGTLGVDVLAGRDLSEAFGTDEHTSMLVNRALIQSVGWGSPEEAIGKTIDIGEDFPFTVVGVLENYHHQTLKEVIEPTFYRIMPAWHRYMAVRINTNDVSTTLAQMETAWNALFPGYTFSSYFLDADFASQYRSEETTGAIVAAFAMIAILIACLGLFGLAAFTAQQRTKEIGVRKVLGASVSKVILLLLREYAILVLVAVVIAWPIAYYAMTRWLEAFPYRTEIGLGLLAVVGLVGLVLALATVSTQSIKAAIANPVDSLKYE